MKNNTRENIKLHIENSFKACDLKYQMINLEDGDINYIISLDISDVIPGTGMQEALIYFSPDGLRCKMFLMNIYRAKPDEKDKFYEIANIINQKLSSGKILVDIDKEKVQLVYADTRMLINIEQLNKELISSMLVAVKIAIALAYTEIKNSKENK